MIYTNRVEETNIAKRKIKYNDFINKKIIDFFPPNYLKSSSDANLLKFKAAVCFVTGILPDSIDDEFISAKYNKGNKNQIIVNHHKITERPTYNASGMGNFSPHGYMLSLSCMHLKNIYEIYPYTEMFINQLPVRKDLFSGETKDRITDLDKFKEYINSKSPSSIYKELKYYYKGRLFLTSCAKLKYKNIVILFPDTLI